MLLPRSHSLDAGAGAANSLTHCSSLTSSESSSIQSSPMPSHASSPPPVPLALSLPRTSPSQPLHANVGNLNFKAPFFLATVNGQQCLIAPNSAALQMLPQHQQQLLLGNVDSLSHFSQSAQHRPSNGSPPIPSRQRHVSNPEHDGAVARQQKQSQHAVAKSCSSVSSHHSRPSTAKSPTNSSQSSSHGCDTNAMEALASAAALLSAAATNVETTMTTVHTECASEGVGPPTNHRSPIHAGPTNLSSPNVNGQPHHYQHPHHPSSTLSPPLPPSSASSVLSSLLTSHVPSAVLLSPRLSQNPLMGPLSPVRSVSIPTEAHSHTVNHSPLFLSPRPYGSHSPTSRFALKSSRSSSGPVPQFLLSSSTPVSPLATHSLSHSSSLPALTAAQQDSVNITKESLNKRRASFSSLNLPQHNSDSQLLNLLSVCSATRRHNNGGHGIEDESISDDASDETSASSDYDSESGSASVSDHDEVANSHTVNVTSPTVKPDELLANTNKSKLRAALQAAQMDVEKKKKAEQRQRMQLFTSGSSTSSASAASASSSTLTHSQQQSQSQSESLTSAQPMRRRRIKREKRVKNNIDTNGSKRRSRKKKTPRINGVKEEKENVSVPQTAKQETAIKIEAESQPSSPPVNSAPKTVDTILNELLSSEATDGKGSRRGRATRNTLLSILDSMLDSSPSAESPVASLPKPTRRKRKSKEFNNPQSTETSPATPAPLTGPISHDSPAMIGLALSPAAPSSASSSISISRPAPSSTRTAPISPSLSPPHLDADLSSVSSNSLTLSFTDIDESTHPEPPPFLLTLESELACESVVGKIDATALEAPQICDTVSLQQRQQQPDKEGMKQARTRAESSLSPPTSAPAQVIQLETEAVHAAAVAAASSTQSEIDMDAHSVAVAEADDSVRSPSSTASTPFASKPARKRKTSLWAHRPKKRRRRRNALPKADDEEVDTEADVETEATEEENEVETEQRQEHEQVQEPTMNNESMSEPPSDEIQQDGSQVEVNGMDEDEDVNENEDDDETPESMSSSPLANETEAERQSRLDHEARASAAYIERYLSSYMTQKLHTPAATRTRARARTSKRDGNKSNPFVEVVEERRGRKRKKVTKLKTEAVVSELLKDVLGDGVAVNSRDRSPSSLSARSPDADLETEVVDGEVDGDAAGANGNSSNNHGASNDGDQRSNDSNKDDAMRDQNNSDIGNHSKVNGNGNDDKKKDDNGGEDGDDDKKRDGDHDAGDAADGEKENDTATESDSEAEFENETKRRRRRGRSAKVRPNSDDENEAQAEESTSESDHLSVSSLSDITSSSTSSSSSDEETESSSSDESDEDSRPKKRSRRSELDKLHEGFAAIVKMEKKQQRRAERQKVRQERKAQERRERDKRRDARASLRKKLLADKRAKKRAEIAARSGRSETAEELAVRLERRRLRTEKKEARATARAEVRRIREEERQKREEEEEEDAAKAGADEERRKKFAEQRKSVAAERRAKAEAAKKARAESAELRRKQQQEQRDKARQEAELELSEASEEDVSPSPARKAKPAESKASARAVMLAKLANEADDDETSSSANNSPSSPEHAPKSAKSQPLARRSATSAALKAKRATTRKAVVDKELRGLSREERRRLEQEKERAAAKPVTQPKPVPAAAVSAVKQLVSVPAVAPASKSAKPNPLKRPAPVPQPSSINELKLSPPHYESIAPPEKAMKLESVDELIPAKPAVTEEIASMPSVPAMPSATASESELSAMELDDTAQSNKQPAREERKVKIPKKESTGKVVKRESVTAPAPPVPAMPISTRHTSQRAVDTDEKMQDAEPVVQPNPTARRGRKAKTASVPEPISPPLSPTYASITVTTVRPVEATVTESATAPPSGIKSTAVAETAVVAATSGPTPPPRQAKTMNSSFWSDEELASLRSGFGQFGADFDAIKRHYKELFKRRTPANLREKMTALNEVS